MNKTLQIKYAPEKKIGSFFTQQKVQISHDGQYIFCQCLNSINIVEINSGNTIKTIESEEDEITELSLAPNNSSLAVGLNSSSVKHYEIKDIATEDPTLLLTFKSYHHGPVMTLCWDASSTLLATGSSDGSVRVWDMKQKFCTHSLKNAHGIIRVLMFDENLHKRPWVYVAGNENIFIWLLEAGNSKFESKLEGHDSAVMGMKLSPSGEELISCGLDKVIILWNLNTFTSIKIIPVFESLSGIVVKPPDMNFHMVPENCKNPIVFTMGNKGTPRIWDVVQGKELWRANDRIILPSEKEILLITQIHFVKSLNSFVLTTHDHNIIFIHCDTMQVWKLLVGHNDEILDVIFLGENESYTVVASNSPQIRIYDNSTTNCLLVTGHTSLVISLANHPVDKNVFASSSNDNTARIWKMNKDDEVECLAIAIGHTHSVGCLALSPDSLITGSQDSCLKRWPIDVQRAIKLNEVSLSSTQTQRAHDKDINGLSLSKNFNLVATCSLDKTAKIWDANTLQLEYTLQGHRKGVWCVQFSPTDRLIATASADATIKLWDIPGFSNIATFEGHEVSVLRICWISSGLRLISSGADGLIKVWSLKNNLCLGTFDEHNGRTWGLIAAENGHKIASGGADSLLILWRDVTEEATKKEQEETQRLIEEEQILLNLVQKKEWSKALCLALRLDQPLRGLKIMKALLDQSTMELFPVLRRLEKDQIVSLIKFAVHWNTKTKNCREAQYVLNYLLKEYLPEDLEALPNWQTSLEGLLPYTEKHFKRISALRQSAAIMQYAKFCLTLGSDQFEESTEVKMEEDDLLLQIIPKDSMPEISDKEITFQIMNRDAFEDEDIIERPLESVEDMQSNFRYEKVLAESTDEDENNLSE